MSVEQGRATRSGRPNTQIWARVRYTVEALLRCDVLPHVRRPRLKRTCPVRSRFHKRRPCGPAPSWPSPPSHTAAVASVPRPPLPRGCRSGRPPIVGAPHSTPQSPIRRGGLSLPGRHAPPLGAAQMPLGTPRAAPPPNLPRGGRGEPAGRSGGGSAGAAAQPQSAPSGNPCPDTHPRGRRGAPRCRWVPRDRSVWFLKFSRWPIDRAVQTMPCYCNVL